MKNHVLVASNDTCSEKDSKNNRAYWFPFKFRDNTRTIQEEIEEFIQQFETDSFVDTKAKRTSKITLLRIHSNLLLPIDPQQKQLKIIYFLCLLKNSFSQQSLETYDLKWMNSAQMKQAAKSYKLMGLEPLLIFKKFVESSTNLNNDLDTYYEPKMSGFLENQGDQTLLTSAKFNSNTVDFLYRLFYSYAYPSEYLNIVRFKHLFELILNAQKEMQRPNAGLTIKSSSYFYSFDAQQKYALSFGDFISGFSAMDPITQHGGKSA